MTLPTVSKAEFNVVGHTVRQYMQPGEQDVLIKLVESVKPHTMIEIGVNVGLTAQAVLRHVESIRRYVGVDVDADYQFEIPAQQSERPVHPGLLVKTDPRFELKLRGDELPLWADAIFIDGDHGCHSVFEDSLWAGGIIRPGGIIIWHDYGNPAVEVTEVLDELESEGREIKHIAGTWLAFERQ